MSQMLRPDFLSLYQNLGREEIKQNTGRTTRPSYTRKVGRRLNTGYSGLRVLRR